MHASSRRVLEIAARIGAVFALHVLLYGALLRAGIAAGELPAPSEPWRVPRSLVAVALLNSIVFSCLILRARERSEQLGWLLGLAFFGGHTVLGRIDSVAFPHVSRVTSELPVPPFVLNAVFTLLFVPLALAILHGGIASPSEVHEPRLARRSVRAWVFRLIGGLVVHQVVFVAAGYWLARVSLQPPDSAAIVAELEHVLRDAPWLPGLQVVRGLLWIALSLPLIRMLTGPLWETSLALGVFWAVVSSGELGLLASHSLDFVSRRYLLLFAAANFVAGALLGAVLRTGRAARADRPGLPDVILYRS
ncbi:MAG: hypothetical protein ABW217_06560 [Polyangiaceae bacterium]